MNLIGGCQICGKPETLKEIETVEGRKISVCFTCFVTLGISALTGQCDLIIKKLDALRKEIEGGKHGKANG